MRRPKQRYTEVKGHTGTKKSHAEKKRATQRKKSRTEAKLEICRGQNNDVQR